jgi:hypothetical protein
VGGNAQSLLLWGEEVRVVKVVVSESCVEGFFGEPWPKLLRQLLGNGRILRGMAMASALITKRSLIEATHSLGEFLLAARAEEAKARQAYAQSKTIESSSRLMSAASHTRKLAAGYDRAVRRAFAEEVFRVRQPIKA